MSVLTASRSTTTSAILRRRADARGLTLLELLIALSIVIVIGAIAIPFTFRAFERRESTAALDRFSMQLHLARSLARSEGVPLALEIDATGRRLNVFEINPREGFVSEDSVQGSVEAWRRIVLPESVRFAPLGEEEWLEPTRLGVFMPDGHLMGFDAIHVVSDRGRKRIDINPWTGSLEVSE